MILEFITSHWYLFAMLAVIVLLLSINPGAGGATKISPLQLPQLQGRESAVIVDVCDVETFKKGHIAQAINLPLEELDAKLARLNKHKSKAIIVACQNGAKSAKAAGILRGKEFAKLYILDGGLAAWRKENLPLVKG